MSSTALPNPSRSADNLHTFIICLPNTIAPPLLPALAHARLTTGGYTPRGPVPYFATSTRRTRRLIDRWRGHTSGGPIELLDLDRMRGLAATAATHTWHRWAYVVSGTPAAKPFWHFVDRHRADEGRYPLTRAQQDYLSQPRITAIRAFNALPQGGGIPTDQLEALQAGLTTYVTIAQLSAVVADGMATAEGDFFTPVSSRLDHQLTFLHHANHHLAGLPRDAPVAAIAVACHPQPIP
ncbi:hypothetical protein [Rugosimonospora africana]|uniref:Uncharacterized protein n=1 Tax=Rugosimonospora africana TaxID=556532 RepID=A0A8J3VS35_9ACTN|nr:hypothetical protein [Rugosimonospora africana]GIH16136.1 hypothetical protein Raf01_43080 [Rugosimonospora africana]